MKSLYLLLFLIMIGPLASQVVGQDSSGQILTRRSVASLENNGERDRSFPLINSKSLASQQETVAGDEPRSTPMISGSFVTVCSSLAIVLGLFAGLVWVTRKFGSNSGGHRSIPKEVIQSLGSTSIDSRTRVTMLRCGNRILVLAQNAQGVQPISEITSPDEVRDLTAACLGSSHAEFATTLQAIEKEPTDSGFLGGQAKPHAARSRGRLFARA